MSGFNHLSGDKVAGAIDKRIVDVAKQVYNKSPMDKTVLGRVVSSKDGIFTVEIQKAVYSGVPALRNAGEIKNGEIVLCCIPNNQYSNMFILGVADGSLHKGGGGSDITVIDSLTSESAIDALSANQGRVLNNKTIQNATAIANTNTRIDELPTANDGTITITQGGTIKGSFTTNQSGNTTINLDAGVDTTETQFSDTGAVSKTLNPNVFYNFTSNAITSLNISFGTAVSGKVNEYMFQFIASSTPTVLTLPSGVVWVDGDAPTITAGKTYQISILNNLAVWGEF